MHDIRRCENYFNIDIYCLSIVPLIGLSGGHPGLPHSHWLVLAAPILIGRPGGPFRFGVKPRIGSFSKILDIIIWIIIMSPSYILLLFHITLRYVIR